MGKGVSLTAHPIPGFMDGPDSNGGDELHRHPACTERCPTSQDHDRERAGRCRGRLIGFRSVRVENVPSKGMCTKTQRWGRHEVLLGLHPHQRDQGKWPRNEAADVGKGQLAALCGP